MITTFPGRPEAAELAPHAKAYVELVQGDDILQILSTQLKDTLELLNSVDPKQASTLAYAPGKWTINEIVCHLSDTERIFSCRALRIARGDTTPLPSFDQDPYVMNSVANQRSTEDLVDEFEAVRHSTLALFRGFSAEAWIRTSQVSEWVLSVRGIAFTTAGHELHHQRILINRYLPLLNGVGAPS